MATARADAAQVRAVIATALDGDFYRTLYPDLQGRVADIVRHYSESGWREGRDPAPWFSTAAYLAAYPEVAQGGWNPFHHYLIQGRYEGREVARSRHADAYLLRRARHGEAPAWTFESLVRRDEMVAAVTDEAQSHGQERRLVEPEFDAAFYLAANADVAEGGMDPLDHFLISGWREGRDPSPAFSVKDYLESYPDIAAADVNPFVHFIRAGRAEGRSGRTDLGFRYDLLKALAPPDERVAAVARASARLKLGTVAALVEGLAAARTGLADLHVTFSHDDYTANTGGVQLCLQREDARIEALGRDHLHIFPAKPWPVVRTKADAGHLGVLLNGKSLGVYAPKTIARALREATKTAGQRSFAIHSLLGHSANETADILAGVGLKAGYFWLHDFASLCAGFHLMRNDVEDCAAPPPDSQACGICVYGPWRARHVAEHARLFERLSLTVVSPAQPTLDLWMARSAYPAAGTVVLPHARLVPKGPAPIPPADRPLRVAFAGMPAAHKGWEIFRALADKHADDPRYHFLHLGGRQPPGAKIEFHKVTVTEAHPRAMQDAIGIQEADV
ncbi:MAG: hypothetical protein JSR98_00155, partial [Proteobacteria bacterium]|nr:hypothetical protein [Pseudomonadota bacterium]